MFLSLYVPPGFEIILWDLASTLITGRYQSRISKNVTLHLASDVQLCNDCLVTQHL